MGKKKPEQETDSNVAVLEPKEETKEELFTFDENNNRLVVNEVAFGDGEVIKGETQPDDAKLAIEGLSQLTQLIQGVIARLDKIEAARALVTELQPAMELKSWEPPQDLSYVNHVATTKAKR